jgi:type II secretory pathway component GspD/PulD (secretin)
MDNKLGHFFLGKVETMRNPILWGKPMAAIVLFSGLALIGGIVLAEVIDASPKALAAQKVLKSKVTVDFKDVRLEECLDEFKDQVKGFKFMVDSKGGVSRNSKLSYTGKDVPLSDALDGLLKKNGLGYQIISNKGNAYDGLIKIVQGADRGKLVK